MLQPFSVTKRWFPPAQSFASSKTVFEKSKSGKTETVSHSSCPALYDTMDRSLPGSSVHGIFQARVLEWVAIPFSKGSSGPRDQTPVAYIAGRFFTVQAIRKSAQE